MLVVKFVVHFVINFGSNEIFEVSLAGGKSIFRLVEVDQNHELRPDARDILFKLQQCHAPVNTGVRSLKLIVGM